MNRRPTTQDVSWFLDLYNNRQIDLDPPYQRRSVWTRKDRTFFLDTIFRDYPCPAIFLHKTTDDDGKTVYHVVDGKQRLETIFAFVNNKISISKTFGDINLDGKKWKDLASSADLQNKFWDYIITVEMVRTIEGTVLNNVFDRLNRNSRKLERQELRHAKYDGWFVSFVEKESEKDEWKRLKVVTSSRAKRMKDVQFLSELLIVLLEHKIVGFDQDYLDDKYAEYDEPLDMLPLFNEDDIIEQFEQVKSYLIEMENYNNCISEHAKTFGSFYSIWTLVVLEYNKLPNAEILAQKYSSFMEAVNEISLQEDLEAFFERKEDARESYKYPTQYFRNSVGASTDYSQRALRYNALINGFDL